MNHRHSAALIGALTLTCGTAGAATIPAFLYADQGTDQIILTRDLDGDGTANGMGETRVLVGGASTTNVFTLAQRSDGDVFYGDGATDTVYRKRPGQDGSADGAVWFSAANAGGLPLLTPNGLAHGPDGAVYVVEADVLSDQSGDFVYRTQDLNGDGDANDAGEAMVWLDLKALSPASSAFEITFDGDTAYIADTRGAQDNVILRARDADRNGVVDASEVTTFISGANPFGVPVDFAFDADGDDVYLWEFLDTTGLQSVFRLNDLDASGMIDAVAEVLEVWNTGLLPDGIESFASFATAVGEEGDLLLTSNDGAAAGDNLFRLVDGNGDGDFLDPGETFTWLSRSINGTLPDRARAVTAYVAPVPLPATLPLLLGTMGLGLAFGRRRA